MSTDYIPGFVLGTYTIQIKSPLLLEFTIQQEEIENKQKVLINK